MLDAACRRARVGVEANTIDLIDAEQAERVNNAQRICIDVSVWVDAAVESDRIGLDVPSGLRIVVAEVVVEEPGLLIQILAGQYPD
jgi:hypothetical protein